MKRLFKTIITLVTVVVLVGGFAAQEVAASEVNPTASVEAQVTTEEGQIDTKGLLEAISPFLQSILEVLATVFAAFAAYYARLYMIQLVEKLRNNTTQEQFWLIRTIVDQLVIAAQQVYKDGDGEEKKQYVLQQAEQMLATYGLNLDIEALDAIIEAAVHDQFHRKPPVWDDRLVTTLPAAAPQK